MTAHAYRVGQNVRVMTSMVPRISGTYKIVALMPEESGHHHYRVQSTSGPQERMISESQIYTADEHETDRL